MELILDDVRALIEQTWQTLFGDVVEFVESADDDRKGLRATVDISGAWSGRVGLHMDSDAALQIACRLLEASPDELEPSAILDAAGEMANILAGNLKSMLPQPSSLGLPVVRTGDAIDDDAAAVGANRQSIAIRWSDTPICITVSPDSRTAVGDRS